VQSVAALGTAAGAQAAVEAHEETRKAPGTTDARLTEDELTLAAKECAKLRQENSDLKQEVERLEQEVERLEQGGGRLRQKLEELRAEYGTTNGMRTQYKEILQKNNGLQRQLTELQYQLVEKNRTTASLCEAKAKLLQMRAKVLQGLEGEFHVLASELLEHAKEYEEYAAAQRKWGESQLEKAKLQPSVSFPSFSADRSPLPKQQNRGETQVELPDDDALEAFGQALLDADDRNDDPFCGPQSKASQDESSGDEAPGIKTAARFVTSSARFKALSDDGSSDEGSGDVAPLARSVASSDEAPSAEESSARKAPSAIFGAQLGGKAPLDEGSSDEGSSDDGAPSEARPVTSLTRFGERVPSAEESSSRYKAPSPASLFGNRRYGGGYGGGNVGYGGVYSSRYYPTLGAPLGKEAS
jgi:cell division septum initiation protein DivIVA